MTDLRKAAEMALEALETAQNGMNECYEETGFDFANEQYEVEQAIQALRQALAEPEQEPDEFCTATTEELMKTLGCSDEKAKEIHDKVEELAQWTDLTEGQLIEALKAANLPSIFSYRAACKIAIDKFKEKNI